MRTHLTVLFPGGTLMVTDNVLTRNGVGHWCWAQFRGTCPCFISRSHAFCSIVSWSWIGACSITQLSSSTTCDATFRPAGPFRKASRCRRTWLQIAGSIINTICYVLRTARAGRTICAVTPFTSCTARDITIVPRSPRWMIFINLSGLSVFPCVSYCDVPLSSRLLPPVM